ncbi:MAG: PAS domain S-box protein, partial [Magnetovibrio sp.]|nr:PAS domain S-box protein [Magnetovibrio sp.]
MVHPDYQGVIECGFDILTAETNVIPLKFVSCKGDIIDVEVMFSPLGDDQYMLEARDITERKRTAEDLKDREQRLRGILDTVADSIITINDRGEILSFNKAAVEIFGYSIREVLNQNISILIPEPHASNHDQYLKNYHATGKKNVIDMVNREEVGLRKDGSEFPMELAVTELRHGSKRFYTGIVRDITKRKESEEALHRAHDELEMRVEERTRELTQEILERHRAEDGLRLSGEVIESLAEGVAIINQDFLITSINPAYSDISGYSTKDLLGNKPIKHAALSEDGGLFKEMWQGLETRGSWEGEFWNVSKTGEKYAERLSVTTITSPDDDVRQFAAIISDITKRKQDEERILFQANYDNLTLLPNRTLFHDRLDQGILNMKRAKKSLGLLFIDLDGF